MVARYHPKDPDEVSRNMSAIRSTGNKTEVALRKTLHRIGAPVSEAEKGLAGSARLRFPPLPRRSLR